MDEVHNLLPFIFSPHSRNQKIAKDYIQSLYDGVLKKRVSLEPLRWKNVLLLFSGLEISTNELAIVEQIYNETKAREPATEGSKHELVWIPIVDTYSKSIEPKLKQFGNVRESMPWYSVYHPSLIVNQVISFIQREWKYKTKPILVVLDPLGRVSSSNAFHMTWIWGSNIAYPFTNSREQALWQEENWRLELLVNGDEISNWIKDEKYIFLYGGNESEWISKFVKEARSVAEATKISLEMLYVGKSSRRKQVQNIVDIIKREKLNTSFLQDQVMIRLFWTRVESMFFSKLQLNQTNEEDQVMREIKKLLIYDKQSGWILLARGSHIVVTGHATTGLQTLEDYENEWKEHGDKDGFEAAFKNHYAKLSSRASPCSKFEVSAEIGETPEKLTCPECNRHMHVFTSIQCCHDGKIDEDFSVSTVTPPTI
ncbi:unnamed protein product [Sphenostylis stenocarpa]|uniref:Sieve element occlusion C-terminal domain-containing protein n=1 Tax=Sphenostylis stenocarpa TaxID=92480 RepID=A0AA86RSZ1_9FABA|nr:unnamed protein product [Sphenostylis stenocarpa]